MIVGVLSVSSSVVRFVLDAETGRVTLRGKLDFELMRRYTLTILARDGGGEETTGRLRVNVLDVNDNVPTFQKESYMGWLRENEQAAQQVVRIRVRYHCFTHGTVGVPVVLSSAVR